MAQPLAEFAEVCRDLGVPLVVDAAQALGHLDCAVGAAAIYSSSRKWMAGPRGVGLLAIHPDLAQRLRPRLPPPEWGLPMPVMQCLELGEANVAARVGYSVALGEHLAAGPEQVRERLAQLGRMTRTALADVKGWRVVEPLDEPTAITTLTPVDGADPREGAGLADRRARHRHHLRRSAACAVRDDHAGAAGIAARRCHRRVISNNSPRRLRSRRRRASRPCALSAERPGT